MAQNKDLVADAQTLLEENLSEKKSVESARRLLFHVPLKSYKHITDYTTYMIQYPATKTIPLEAKKYVYLTFSTLKASHRTWWFSPYMVLHVSRILMKLLLNLFSNRIESTVQTLLYSIVLLGL